jgi:hypothetical protein
MIPHHQIKDKGGQRLCFFEHVLFNLSQISRNSHAKHFKSLINTGFIYLLASLPGHEHLVLQEVHFEKERIKIFNKQIFE